MKKLLLLFLLIPSLCNAATFFQDGFETGNLTHTENSAAWLSTVTITGAENGVTPATGSYMARFRYDTGGGQPAPGAELRFTLGSHKTETYIQYKVWIPSNFGASGSQNNKLIRLWDDVGDTAYNASHVKQGAEYRDYSDSGKLWRMYPVAPTDSGSPSCNSTAAGPVSIWGYPEYRPSTDLKGRWSTWEWHFKADSGAGDGAEEMWIDGVIAYSVTGKSWVAAPCSPGYFLAGYLFGSANSGFVAQTDIYIDDVKFADEYIGVGAINGACGSSSGGAFLTTPTSNLCASGSATTVNGTGPWTWGCNGLNGGTSTAADACTASKTADSTAPTTASNKSGRTSSRSAVILSCSDNVSCSSTLYCLAATATGTCTPGLTYSTPFIAGENLPWYRYCYASSDGTNTETTKCSGGRYQRRR